MQLFYLPVYPSEIKTLYDKGREAYSSSVVTQVANDFPKTSDFLAGIPLAYAQPGLPLQKKSPTLNPLSYFNLPFSENQGKKINQFSYFANTVAGSHLQIMDEFNFPFQSASGDASGWHEFCWDETLNAFDFLIDIAQAFVWLFGPAIVLAATIIALLL